MAFNPAMPSYGSRVAAATRAPATVALPSRGDSQTQSKMGVGASAARSRALLAGQFTGTNTTPYLVMLVLLEASALLALRHGFRNYHGG